MVNRAATPAVAAVIFDLDGVLVDTEPLHLAATRTLVAPAELRLDDYRHFIGRGGFENWIETTYGITRAQIDARYDDLFYSQLALAPLQPLAGATELVDAVIARGIGLAIASQSTRAWVEATLCSTGLRDRFPLVVTAADVGRDKPAPSIYIHAAHLLGATPECCIAIEDSVHGVASASAAGMRVVQSTQASFAPPPQPGANALIASLQDFDQDWLDGAPLR